MREATVSSAADNSPRPVDQGHRRYSVVNIPVPSRSYDARPPFSALAGCCTYGPFVWTGCEPRRRIDPTGRAAVRGLAGGPSFGSRTKYKPHGVKDLSGGRNGIWI
jgi:hypothetical protein